MIPYLLAIAGGYLIGSATEEKQYFNNGGQIKELFPKEKLLSLLKETKFKSFDSSEIKDIEYEGESYNPFDIYFVAKINAYPCLIKIDKISKDIYEIKIGKNTGWIGGIFFGNWDYVFEISRLNFEEFKKGLIKAVKDKNIFLYSKFGTGNINKFYFKGTIEQAKDFAKKNGYVPKYFENKKLGISYFYNPQKQNWEDSKSLFIGTFTDRQIEKFGGIKNL
jgi:hypothetical protein